MVLIITTRPSQARRKLRTSDSLLSQSGGCVEHGEELARLATERDELLSSLAAETAARQNQAKTAERELEQAMEREKVPSRRYESRARNDGYVWTMASGGFRGGGRGPWRGGGRHRGNVLAGRPKNLGGGNESLYPPLTMAVLSYSCENLN